MVLTPDSRVLSGPSGMGKSYEAWFYAASSHHHGWILEYIASAKQWAQASFESDAVDIEQCAVFWLQEFLRLNMGVYHPEFDVIPDPNAGKRKIMQLVEYLSIIASDSLRSCAPRPPSIQRFILDYIRNRVFLPPPTC